MNRREICLGFSCRVFRAITMKHCSLSLCTPSLREVHLNTQHTRWRGEHLSRWRAVLPKPLSALCSHETICPPRGLALGMMHVDTLSGRPLASRPAPISRKHLSVPDRSPRDLCSLLRPSS